MPHDSMTESFSCAVPLPPEMIAPAWPMRLPGGAVCPAMNAATGLVQRSPRDLARVSTAAPPDPPPPLSLPGPAEPAAPQDRPGPRVVLEQPPPLDERGADDRVAAQPHA